MEAGRNPGLSLNRLDTFGRIHPLERRRRNGIEEASTEPLEGNVVVRQQAPKCAQFERVRYHSLDGEWCMSQRLKLSPQDVSLFSETSRFGAQVPECVVAGQSVA